MININMKGLLNPTIRDYLNELQPKGLGLCVGYSNQDFKEDFKSDYSQAEIVLIDIEGNPDIKADICKPIPTNLKFKWVFCQAVLEHVADPVGAIRNLLEVCEVGADLLFHTHSVNFPEHRFPIDCWRMMEDTPKAIAGLLNVELFKQRCNKDNVVFWLKKR